MSDKNLYYNDVTIIKHKRKFFKKLKKFMLFFMLLAVIIVFADVFSNLLSVGKFTFSFNLPMQNSISNSTTFYGLSLGEYNSIDEANVVVNSIIVQGAGGYVFEYENKFNVLGNVYLDDKSANAVKSNLESSNYNVKVLTINCNMCVLKDDYSNKDKSILISAMDFIKCCIQTIYDYSIKYDTQNLSAIAISGKINSLYGDCKVLRYKLDEINNRLKYESCEYILNQVIKLENNLNQLMLSSLNQSNLNHYLKFANCDIVVMYYNICKNM